MTKLPVVALIGSPNVGKSTIFNRIVGYRHSIVDDTPGITRDRIYAEASWLNKRFQIIDTGGIEISDRPFQQQIKIQAEIAIREADVIVFVLDGNLGLTSDDRLVSKMLLKSGKKIILAVNKIDDRAFLSSADEFYSLALGDPVPVSGIHGIGIGDLLDKIIADLPEEKEVEETDKITFCLIGRPNVGKSSLVNAILKKNRVIASDIAGTTRDAIDTPFTRDEKEYLIIDTAGLKKRGKIYESIDKYSAFRALRAIDRSDIVLLVLDADAGIIEQDKHVISYATENNKAIIIVVNKWDLIVKDQHTMDNFTKLIRKEFKFLDYAPIVYVSAKDNRRIDTIFAAIERVHEAYHTRIKTSILNEVIQDAQIMNPAPLFNNGRLKISFASQTDIKPPTFVLFCNKPKYMHFSYQRYIENRLRETFNFDGTPIKIVLREKK